MRDKRRIIADPLYGPIEIPLRLEAILADRAVQRLRRISQTGLAEHVYSSLNVSRFSHALGTMELARRAWTHAWRNADDQTRAAFRDAIPVERPPEDFLGDVLAAVGLLHDVGHPPFSHALEPYFADRLAHVNVDIPTTMQGSRSFHELAGVKIVGPLLERALQRTDQDKVAYSEFVALVKSVYQANSQDGTWAGACHSLVADDIDVDRIDYLMRDARGAGTEYGRLNFARIVDNAELVFDQKGFRILPGLRARPAVERVLVERGQSYQWIYFHSGVVAQDHSLLRALETLDELIDGADPHGADERLRAELERARPLSIDLTDEEAGPFLDDASIVEWLKRALLICTGGRSGPATAPVARFTQLASAALFREKTLYPIWKAPDEFADSVTKVASAEVLGAALNRSSDYLENLCEGDELRMARNWVERKRVVLRNKPDVAVSDLLSQLVFDARPARGGGAGEGNLAAHLGSFEKSRLYQWEVARRQFDPGRQLQVLHGDGGDVSVTRTSALAPAAGRAGLGLPDIHIFIVDLSSTNRALARNAFELAFPSFVEARLPRVALDAVRTPPKLGS